MDTPAEQTFEEKVNTLVGSMEKDEAGKWQVPGELDEPTAFAVMAERRRRDTQASFTQNQQMLKALETENSTLAELLESGAATSLTEEQKEELEDLKQTDPEQWRTKLNEHETAHKAELANKREEARNKGQQESELTRRERLLSEFNEANPNIQLTDDVVDLELPGKFKKQLDNGEATFEEFLANAKAFLSKGKAVDKGDPLADKSLSNAGGGSTPSKEALNADITESYASEIY